MRIVQRGTTNDFYSIDLPSRPEAPLEIWRPHHSGTLGSKLPGAKIRSAQAAVLRATEDAIAKRDALLSSAVNGTYSDPKTTFTVADALKHWLEHRHAEVKPVTLIGYRQSARYIVGPLMIGTARERKAYTEANDKPDGAQFAPMLGPSRIADLTTGDIRHWHKTLTTLVSSHTANRAKAVLRSALALAAEDFHLRVPPMPLNLGRNRTKPKKVILTRVHSHEYPAAPYSRL